MTAALDRRPRWHLRAAGAVSLRSYASFLQAYAAALPLLRDGYELEAIDETALAEHRPGIPLGLPASNRSGANGFANIDAGGARSRSVS